VNLPPRTSVLAALLSILVVPHAAFAASGLTFCCDASNDLYAAVVAVGTQADRVDTVADAFAKARDGSGVLLLADGYPKSRNAVDEAVLRSARAKHLKLFIEFPAAYPGLQFGQPQQAVWERAVVATEALHPDGLDRLRILAAHGCSFTPVTSEHIQPVLSLARVAGFDTAVYGLPEKQYPLLFRTNDGDLVATTKLSNFVTARYAPAAAWPALWKHVLAQLDPSGKSPPLKFTPTVTPSYARDAELPRDAERAAVDRFAAWVQHSGLLVSPQEKEAIYKLTAANAPPMDPPAPNQPAGDGSLGILEGFASQIHPDGQQGRYTALRADCNAESAMTLALAGGERNQTVARNLLDFVYVKSDLCGGVRADPKHPAFGLIGWGSMSPAWIRANYGDDNARTLLATMLAAASLKSDAWDEAILKGLLANLRTTGKFGFRGDRIDIPDLEKNGWRFYHDGATVNYALNFEAYLWACYLWAYHQTGEREFLDKAKTAISMTMAAYPNGWRWGDNMERARMLLPLAWLVRVEDTPEHRAWIAKIAGDLVERQDACGAIPEHLGGDGTGGGHYHTPASNDAYGTSETPLIQTNGDAVSDQLYTAWFALIALHESYAVTGDAKLRAAEDKLAQYLVRIQVKSSKVPYVDGCWFRAFDFGKWDYWASSADVGWGAWSAEAGWCQAWTAATLALRAKDTSMWDLTEGSRIEQQMSRVAPLMK
jgi:hypothetical protein